MCGEIEEENRLQADLLQRFRVHSQRVVEAVMLGYGEAETPMPSAASTLGMILPITGFRFRSRKFRDPSGRRLRGQLGAQCRHAFARQAGGRLHGLRHVAQRT